MNNQGLKVRNINNQIYASIISQSLFFNKIWSTNYFKGSSKREYEIEFDERYVWDINKFSTCRGCIKSKMYKVMTCNLKFQTPPNLPKGEELSPFGGIRGSYHKCNFQIVSKTFSRIPFETAPFLLVT